MTDPCLHDDPDPLGLRDRQHPRLRLGHADGSGQTIAIVDAYNDPDVFSDVDQFDQPWSTMYDSLETLYQQYGPASSFLTVYNEQGTNITSEIADSGVGNVPPVDPTGGWEGEATGMWKMAHAIAPGARIDLIECSGGYLEDLFDGAVTAASLPGVSVVSMSWAIGVRVFRRSWLR